MNALRRMLKFEFTPRTLSLMLILALLAPGMAHGLSLELQAQDAQKAAVSGAKVWVVQDTNLFTGETDGEGKCRIEPLDTAPTLVVVHKPGLAFAFISDYLLRDTRLPVALAPGETLHVRAVTGEGQPLPGARVRMLVMGYAPLPVEELGPLGFPKWRSDDQGQITIEDLPKEVPLSLWITHYQYADAEVLAIPGKEDDREATMLPGAALRGRVSHEGTPVPNARATLFQIKEGVTKIFAETLTTSEGLYNLQAGRGEYLLRVRHRDFASPVPSRVLLGQSLDAALCDVAMPSPRYLSGQVLMPDKTPCMGANITYRQGQGGEEMALSDAEGRFSLRVTEGGGTLTVQPPPGFMLDKNGLVPVLFDKGDRINLAPFVLHELPVVTGTVTDTDKIPAARVLLTSMNKGLPYWTWTDDHGAFRIQLAAVPEGGKGVFRAEHPEHFQRNDFTVDFSHLEPVQVQLKPFEPDTTQNSAKPEFRGIAELAGKPAPALACRKWLNTDALKPEQLRGKVVVLTFLAGFDRSPLGLSRRDEIRALRDLLRDNNGIVFVGIHEGSSTDTEIEDFVKGSGLDFPMGIDSENLDTFTAFKVDTLPQTVLIDQQGTLCFYDTTGRILEQIKTLTRKQ